MYARSSNLCRQKCDLEEGGTTTRGSMEEASTAGGGGKRKLHGEGQVPGGRSGRNLQNGRDLKPERIDELK